MPRWAMVVTGLILVVGLTAGYLGFRPRMSDRDRIYHLLADIQQKANQGAYLSLLQYVYDDYRDGAGYTKNDLKRLALQAGRSGEKVRVEIEIKGLVLVGTTATLQVRLRVMRESLATESPPGQAEEYQVTVTLHKRRGRWLIAKADGWQEAAFGETGGE